MVFSFKIFSDTPYKFFNEEFFNIGQDLTDPIPPTLSLKSPPCILFTQYEVFSEKIVFISRKFLLSKI